MPPFESYRGELLALGEFYAGRGQSVIAADGAVRQHEYERRRHVLAGIPASPAS